MGSYWCRWFELGNAEIAGGTRSLRFRFRHATRALSTTNKVLYAGIAIRWIWLSGNADLAIDVGGLQRQ